MNVQKHDQFHGKATAKQAKSSKRDADPKDRAETLELSRKRYEKEMEKLQIQICYLQDWVRETGARVVIVCEGRDTAGKGGLIKRLIERVSQRAQRTRTPETVPATLRRAVTGRWRGRDLRSQLV